MNEYTCLILHSSIYHFQIITVSHVLREPSRWNFSSSSRNGLDFLHNHQIMCIFPQLEYFSFFYTVFHFSFFLSSFCFCLPFSFNSLPLSLCLAHTHIFSFHYGILWEEVCLSINELTLTRDLLCVNDTSWPIRLLLVNLSVSQWVHGVEGWGEAAVLDGLHNKQLTAVEGRIVISLTVFWFL